MCTEAFCKRFVFRKSLTREYLMYIKYARVSEQYVCLRKQTPLLKICKIMRGCRANPQNNDTQINRWRRSRHASVCCCFARWSMLAVAVEMCSVSEKRNKNQPGMSRRPRRPSLRPVHATWNSVHFLLLRLVVYRKFEEWKYNPSLNKQQSDMVTWNTLQIRLSDFPNK